MKIPEVKIRQKFKFLKNRVFWLFVLIVFISSLFGFLGGIFAGSYFYIEVKERLKQLKTSETKEEKIIKEYLPQTSHEELVIKAVKEISPAVVSIIISKDVPVFEEYFYNPFKEFEEFFGPMPEFQIPEYRQKGTEKREIGGGTGFIISEDGMILTNKHVVSEEDAEYTVYTNDGKKFSAKVLARDPVQDIAILKIEQEKTVTASGETKKAFPVVKLGDSDKLQIGQTVIAIGNALGEFRNTVSVGVISGLGRTITASGGTTMETLEDVIQTDAAINRGNSGGPLLNLKGEVIGINTAMAIGAQNIGFAVPINKAKRAIKQIKTIGKIVYPFLGVRYVLVNEEIKEKKNLSVDYGALIVKGGNGEPGVTPNSAADKAGLREGDIILELNNEKISQKNSLAKIISKYNPGDKVSLKVLRDKKEINIDVVLGERSE